jgi:patatin-related protein
MTAPDTSGTQTSEQRADHFETRIALAFFGGVSLAVYESGIAVEFFRLVTDRDGIYKKLRDRIGRVMVDIISGTSAGALSAAFLANALINRSGSLDPLMQLWLEKADLDTLLNPPTEGEAKSLLSGEEFLRLIKEALEEMAGNEVASVPYQPYLDLFITATNLEGDTRPFKLDKNRIEARSHQRIFHFRYRGEQRDGRNVGEQQHNDFEPRSLPLLAVAARTSASFPLAFEPVLIKKAEFGALSPDLEKDAYHIDGGILDNKPIRLALDAIFHRRTDRQVDRRLFYVEPMPEEISSGAGGDLRKFKPLNVLYAAIKDLPSYQSITSALEEIDERNCQVQELRRTIDHYETLAARAGDRRDAAQGSHDISATSFFPTNRYFSAKDAPTQLFRAQEDGYLDLRLARKFPALFVHCDAIGKQLESWTRCSGRLYVAVHEAFYHFKNYILYSCDLDYHRCHYHYLHQVVRGLFARLDEGELFKDQSDRQAIFVSLNDLRRLFNDQEEAIVATQIHAAQCEAASAYHIQELLRSLRVKLEACPSRDEKMLAALVQGASAELMDRSSIKERWKFFAHLRETACLKLEIERRQFDLKAMSKRNDPRVADRLTEGYEALLLALSQFYKRDMIIYPMMHGNDMLASELQEVRVARFGPLDGHAYVKLTDVRHKLAGETAMRFGGFMDSTWRGNDLIWGRLDAVENIFRQLLPGGEDDLLFKEVRQEQMRIVVEMRKMFTKGIVHPLEKQDIKGEPPHEELLIGKQNLHHISEEKKVAWLKKGIATLIRMIPFPETFVPAWSRRHLSKFFVDVLIQPERAVLRTAAVLAVGLLGFSLVVALALTKWFPHLRAEMGWTAAVVASLWVFLATLIFLRILSIAHSIRAKFLKITPPGCK